MKAKNDKPNPGKGPKDKEDKVPKSPKGCIEVTNLTTGLRELVPGSTIARVSEVAGTAGGPTTAAITLKVLDAGPGIIIRTEESYDEVIDKIREHD